MRELMSRIKMPLEQPYLLLVRVLLVFARSLSLSLSLSLAYNSDSMTANRLSTR